MHPVSELLIEHLTQQLSRANDGDVHALEVGELAHHHVVPGQRHWRSKNRLNVDARARFERKHMQQVRIQRHDRLQLPDAGVAVLHLLQHVDLDDSKLRLTGGQHREVLQTAAAGDVADRDRFAAHRLHVLHHQRVDLATRPAGHAQGGLALGLLGQRSRHGAQDNGGAAEGQADGTQWCFHDGYLGLFNERWGERCEAVGRHEAANHPNLLNTARPAKAAAGNQSWRSSAMFSRMS